MIDENTGEEPRCLFCGSTDDCKHLLAVIDRSFLDCYGGYAFARLDEFRKVISNVFVKIIRTGSFQHNWKNSILNELWVLAVDAYKPKDAIPLKDEAAAEKYYKTLEQELYVDQDILFDFIMDLFTEADAEEYDGSIDDLGGPCMSSAIRLFYAENPQKVFKKALSILRKSVEKTIPKGSLSYPVFLAQLSGRIDIGAESSQEANQKTGTKTISKTSERQSKTKKLELQPEFQKELDDWFTGMSSDAYDQMNSGYLAEQECAGQETEEKGKDVDSGVYWYESEIPYTDLYDFDADPQGLRLKAQQMTLQNPQKIFLNVYEHLIKDAGYKGYWKNTDMGPIAAVYERIKVVRVDPEKYTRKESDWLQ